jgi:hypothetical protein
LIFGKNKKLSSTIDLNGYCDSDWAGDHISRKSTTGYVFTINGSPVVWYSKKQQVNALSSTEAEYVASAEAVKECLWLKQLLTDIGCHIESPTVIYSDNQGSILLSKNPGHHTRTKHIDVRHHFIREKQEEGVIKLEYISTHQQPADMLTKSLVRPKLTACCELLNLQDDDID